ncbi:MAG: RpiB/LacA/LacB family sugar-phosphate isomerase [Bacilli bacterium]
MTIAFASDHRGYKLKQRLTKYFEKEGYNIIDLGTNSDISVDYPDYAFKMGEVINSKKADLGVIMCGTGIGVSISCNKIKGMYCALVNTVDEAVLARRHNNANILALRGNMNGMTAKNIIRVFITTNFSNAERHRNRIKKINKFESK